MTGSPRTNHPLTLALLAGGAAAAAAKKKLRRAVDANDGRLDEIATELRASRNTVIRLLERAELLDYAADVRVRAGVPGPRTAQAGVAKPRK